MLGAAVCLAVSVCVEFACCLWLCLKFADCLLV